MFQWDYFLLAGARNLPAACRVVWRVSRKEEGAATMATGGGGQPRREEGGEICWRVFEREGKRFRQRGGGGNPAFFTQRFERSLERGGSKEKEKEPFMKKSGGGEVGTFKTSLAKKKAILVVAAPRKGKKKSLPGWGPGKGKLPIRCPSGVSKNPIVSAACQPAWRDEKKSVQGFGGRKARQHLAPAPKKGRGSRNNVKKKKKRR